MGPASVTRSMADKWDDYERSNHSHSSHSTRSKRTAHLRYEAAPKARPAFGIKHGWDGSRSTFEMFQRMIEGYLLQVGAGYLVNPHFLKMYENEGGDYFLSDDFWSCYNISVKQGQYYRKYLYGILVTTNRKRDSKHILKPVSYTHLTLPTILLV